ncbi:MAG TPA: AmmeMemoRadiSam system radical SAM enzyme [Vicinamibacterales bacterium]|nr:AmmeMemoRadiSam system radical SAM enzyme [Vicinamibacterales bacterium]
MSSLAQILEARTAEAAPELVEPISRNRLRCYACGHECPIPDGAVGVCKVRFNRGGRLHVPWGYVGGIQCDPIEKKPFFHARPGALAFSFGMLGCDLHCSYCQNWVTSQALRDPQAVAPPLDADPAPLVAEAVRLGARVVVSTYNEPLITSEWAVEIFRHARRAGLMTGFVSNGNGTERVLNYLRPHIDLYKVDLKSFDDRHYRQLGGRLEPILFTIRRLRELDVWVEIVTLLIPGFNNSRDELERMTAFLAGISPDLPWHVTAFHKDYRMNDPENTTPEMLMEAAEIGRANGLRYVYAGNLPGRVGDLEHTRCHSCRAMLVERYGYFIQDYRLTPEGTCPDCGTRIPGRWGTNFEGQITASPFLPGRRLRVV